MQRIVIDTNVLVSALIQKSYPYLIINQVISRNDLKLCLSDEIFSEYFAVLNRTKFSKYYEFRTRAELLLADLERIGLHFNPQNKLDVISDKDDNKFLELCFEANADFLITGDINDFTMKKFKNTLIVSPKEFWELHSI